MATIGNLFVTVGANVAPLQKGLGEAEKSIKGFASQMLGTTMGVAGIISSVLPGAAGQAASRIMSGLQGVQSVVGKLGGLAQSLGPLLANPFVIAGVAIAAVAISIAAVIGGIVMMTMKAAALADRLKETTDEVGTTAENFQKLTYIGTAAGASAEKIQGSMTKMSMAIAEAGRGGKEATEKFSKLGINIEELGNMDPSKAFELLIKKISELPSHTEKVKALRDIFGRGGTGLAGMVNLSTEEFKKLSAEAAKFTIKEDSVKQLASLQDSMDTFWLAIERVTTEAFAPFAGMIQVVFDWMKKLLELNSDSLFTGLKTVADVLIDIVDALTPIYHFFALIINAVASVNQMLMALALGPVLLLLKGVKLLIETMNLVPGIDIPTKGLEKSIDFIDVLQQKAIKNSLESGAAVGQHFVDGVEASMKNANGEKGNFRNAVDAVEQSNTSKPTSTEPPQFKVVDQKAVAHADELKKKLEDMQIALDNINKTDAQIMTDQLQKLGAQSADIYKGIRLQEQIKKATEDKANQTAVAKQLEDLTVAQEKLAMSDQELLAAQLQKIGATEQQIEQAVAQTQILKEMQEKKQDEKSVVDTLENLRAAYAEMLAGADNSLERSLAALHATAEQIAEATDLKTKMDDMAKAAEDAKSLQTIMDDVAKKQEDAGKSEIQLLQERMKLLGATQAQIDATTASLQATNVGQMLDDLAESARTAGMNEKELLADKLRSAGATEEQIQKGLSLQAQAEKLKTGSKDKDKNKKEQGNIDAIDTALGSMKIAGLVGMTEIADSQLSEAVTQTGLLQDIADQTDSATASVTQAANYNGGSEETDKTMSRQLDLLTEIAANTKAFAGAMQ